MQNMIFFSSNMWNFLPSFGKRILRWYVGWKIFYIIIMAATASSQFENITVPQYSSGELSCAPVDKYNMENILSINWFKSMNKDKYTNGNLPLIAWSKGAMYPSDPGFNMTSDYSLVIPNVLKNSTGVYRCIVYWTEGSDYSDVRLIVLDPPDDSTTPAFMKTTQAKNDSTKTNSTSPSPKCDFIEWSRKDVLLGYLVYPVVTTPVWLLVICLIKYAALQKGFKQLFSKLRNTEKKAGENGADELPATNGEHVKLNVEV